jgi:hypothetical protein
VSVGQVVMDAGDALEVLESLRPDLPDVDASTGIKDRGREPYLLLTNTADPDKWAVVYTNIAWTSVQTDTHYSRLHIDEEISRDELADVLEDFVRNAVAYVQGAGEIVRTGFFKIPKLVVQVGDREDELTQTLGRTIASIFRPSSGPAPTGI